jgi:hypothetical protein
VAHSWVAITLSGIVDDGDESVAIVTDVEDDVTIHVVCIRERLSHLHEVLPTRVFHDLDPCTDLGGGILVSVGGFTQMPPGYHVHVASIFSD